MGMVQNPILGGFYPDPSICSVMEKDAEGHVIDIDYYLVNSTFAYVPGVPVFHSKNLEEWKQIGHVLERKEQLKVEGIGISEGIYAPTIRCHKGTFYMITTNVSAGGNFYVTAEDPRGPWSDPVYLEDAQGIDPSLYFEGDACYYIGQRTKADAKYFGDCEIWLQELDLKQKRLVGEAYSLWDGAMKHAIWPEGPHLYKRGEYYYILIAEGGTAESHSICVARSKSVTGPYESCPNNPIFTHRHLGRTAEIQNVGHGDLVEAPDGKWYIVMLATRPLEGCAPLGRETFLAEVSWENDWPVINPGEGRLRKVQEVEAGQKCCQNKKNNTIEWKEPLDMRCLFYGWPKENMYRIQENPDGSKLALRIQKSRFEKMESPSYIGVRVTNRNFSLRTEMKFCAEKGEEAGLVYLYDEKNYVKFVLCRTEVGNEEFRVMRMTDGVEKLIQTVDGSEKEKYLLELSLHGLKLSCGVDEMIIAEVDIRNLTSEVAGGFVGCTAGVYAGIFAGYEENEKADHYACFSEMTIDAYDTCF